ncbi:MAG: ribosome maturation factor RimP [Erysipelotrichaceae bacterium]
MEVKAIKELIQPILDQSKVTLYDVKWVNQGKNRILQVAIMHDDGSMDLDTCQEVSEAISLKLDESPLSDVNYFLEVCSPGAERELRSSKDIEQVIGQHIYVLFNESVGKLQEVKGDLLSYENNELTVSYQDKSVKRKVSFKEDNIAKINLAVHI